MAFSLSPKVRLIITIIISSCFFVAEITGQPSKNKRPHNVLGLTMSIVAFKTASLALLADAFHYVRSPDSSSTGDHIRLTEPAS